MGEGRREIGGKRGRRGGEGEEGDRRKEREERRGGGQSSNMTVARSIK